MGEDRAVPPRRRPLPALQDRRGTDDLRPVVREDRPACEAGDRGREGRSDGVRPGELDEGLHRLDGEHPGLVHLPPALVGSSDPRVVLRGLQ